MGFFSTSKPWKKRNYNEKLFHIPLPYLIKHLDKVDHNKILGKNRFGLKDTWQEKKVQEVLSHFNHYKKKPIRLTFHNTKEEFRIDDGASRIIAYKRNNVHKIPAEVRIGNW